MENKYQFFVSSTYEDLFKEREEVAKAILEIGDIPVGMEMFSAADETQWKLIQRQIEQSDYYIVLVAHRYGSMAGDVSYTEREYDYALEIGVPVLGFILDSNAQWPPNFIDANPDDRDRLLKFKDKVKTRMVSFWTNTDNLSGRILAAIGKQKILSPRPGWMRAVNVPGPEVIAELGRLGKEVVRLSEENAQLREKASIEATFSLIDAMADDVECQAIILLYETGRDIQRFVRIIHRYRNGGGGSSMLGMSGRGERLISAGLVRSGGGGNLLTLTEMGRSFAEWLIKKGRKCEFLWSPIGGWGTLDKDTPEAAWIADAVKENESMKR